MNRVSDERLAELIGFQRSRVANGTDSLSEHLQQRERDKLACLAELQSLRQASVAGVEDAAERITEIVYDCIDCADGGVLTFDRMSAMAGVTAELTALLAERDAVLRECREIVQERRDAWALMTETFRSDHSKLDRDQEIATCSVLLNRIDAIIGKERDGA